jgi:6,7-dimethyl-8-ribityllumazine synthase
LQQLLHFGNHPEKRHISTTFVQATQGIKDCNILTDTPAIFCVLTDDTKEQSIAEVVETLKQRCRSSRYGAEND